MANTHLTFRTASSTRRTAQQIYRGVYSGAPLPFLLMTPEFEIIDANDAYLAATMRQRESLAGCDMFDAFPDNPMIREADGVANLRQSLTQARSTGARHIMNVQRYDVINREGQWEERYWRPANWAVRDKSGSVLALVHHVTDVTAETLIRTSVEWSAMLLRRADAVCEESRRLCEETHRQLAQLRRPRHPR